MTSPPNPLVPDRYQSMRRPESGSWLDTTANRVITLLQERYGIIDFDRDSTYMTVAGGITERQEFIAAQTGSSTESLQHLYTEASLERIAADLAVSFSSSNPGGDPYADTDTVPVPVTEWAHATLGLQIGALAVQTVSPGYAQMLMKFAVSMTSTLTIASAAGPLGTSFGAPRAGTAYTQRMLNSTKELVLEWDVGYDDMNATQLSEGLAVDAKNLGKALG